VSLLLLVAYLLAGSPVNAQTIGEDRYVDFAHHAGEFSLVAGNAVATLYVDSADFPGVIRAAATCRRTFNALRTGTR